MKQRGIALVIAIMVLLVISVIGAGVMVITKTEMQLSSHQVWRTQALAVAEAGMAEAIQRLRLSSSDTLFIGDTSSVVDPDWCAVIYLGENDFQSGDTFYYHSVQAGLDDVLLYADTTPYSDYNIRIYHKQDASGRVYFYDPGTRTQFAADPANVEDLYYPVNIVEVVGRAGKARQSIIAEVARVSVTAKVQAAFNVGALTIQGGGGDVRVCGHNHKKTTPHMVGGVVVAPDKATDDSTSCYYRDPSTGEEVYHVPRDSAGNITPHPFTVGVFDNYCAQSHCVPGLLCISATTVTGTNPVWSDFDIFGNPDHMVDPTATIPPIWELFGFDSETELLSEINWTVVNSGDPLPGGFMLCNGDYAAPRSTNVYTGVLWVRGGTFSYNGGGGAPGSGIGFFFKGLIYADDINVRGGNAPFWVLGGVIGRNSADFHGGGIDRSICVLYSRGVLTQEISTQIQSPMLLLGWRERY